MGKFLITRPINDSLKLSNLIKELGYETICAPFIEIEYHKANLPKLSEYDALIFTSKHAVRSFCALSKNRGIDCYSVGGTTKRALADAGFVKVHTANNSVNSLLEILPKSLKYIYIRGEDITQPLKDINYTSVVVYKSNQIDGLSDSLVDYIINDEIGDIIFYSKRTAASFIRAVRKNRCSERLIHRLRRTRALCLSNELVKYVSQLSENDEQQIIWRSVLGAQIPSNESLIDLIRQ